MLVECAGDALPTIAAYLDLDPLPAAMVQAVPAVKGKLTRPELARCRVRYFASL